MTERAPIGLFDSGIGGLTVVKEIFRQLPKEQVIYYGDTLRCPYGDRNREEIIQFSTEIGDFLVDHGIKLLIIACNTATATSLSILQERYSIPVIGVIRPGSRAAISFSKSMRVGVIGTRVTIASEAYANEIIRINPDMYVTSRACPSFVPLVEQDLLHTELCHQAVEQELADFKQEDIDTLILGCTHYPLLKDSIGKIMGPDVQLINSAEETAREASTILSVKNMLSTQPSRLNHKFYVSGNIEVFQTVGERWLGRPIQVDQVILGTANQI